MVSLIDTNPKIGVVVGLSICSSMIIATGVGTFTPLALRRLDIDPTATGPFVTTSIDILGVFHIFYRRSINSDLNDLPAINFYNCLCFFYLFIISGLFKHNILPISNSDSLPFVSVIIAARNEENNLLH